MSKLYQLPDDSWLDLLTVRGLHAYEATISLTNQIRTRPRVQVETDAKHPDACAVWLLYFDTYENACRYRDRLAAAVGTRHREYLEELKVTPSQPQPRKETWSLISRIRGVIRGLATWFRGRG